MGFVALAFSQSVNLSTRSSSHLTLYLDIWKGHVHTCGEFLNLILPRIQCHPLAKLDSENKCSVCFQFHPIWEMQFQQRQKLKITGTVHTVQHSIHTCPTDCGRKLAPACFSNLNLPLSIGNVYHIRFRVVVKGVVLFERQRSAPKPVCVHMQNNLLHPSSQVDIASYKLKGNYINKDQWHLLHGKLFLACRAVARIFINSVGLLERELENPVI